MDPHLFQSWINTLKLAYFVSESLINHYVVHPQLVEFKVCQMCQVGLIQRLEVVEQGLHHILIEVVVREQLVHGHEDRVAPFLG